MSILVTGAAGFVGSNLVRELLRQGRRIVAFDNLVRGSPANLAAVHNHPGFVFDRVDLDDLAALTAAVAGHHRREPITEVWHLAANSDIPAGVDDPTVDLRDTFMTTFNLLRVMRELHIPSLAFASSSAIYGNWPGVQLTEATGPCFPISNYGAMKLACEGIISAAVESHLRQAFIFRFPNVVGTPATHGVLFDFVRKLRATPDVLPVLGDGTQQKCYLHVDDLLDAMRFIREHAQDRLNCFNIGADDDGVTVRFIAEETVAVVSPGARLEFGQGNRGWVGDVPRFELSVDKLHALGWRPRAGSAEAIRRAIRQVAAQPNLP
ncbi:MAG TPA: NAD-dependent epimerase/dehydratase family protein [Stellaceae bacterium]|nr:NAD-dependent epimerase/dehydratase family protein [Stellaceae bacterium]